jgi:hypothetical protein
VRRPEKVEQDALGGLSGNGVALVRAFHPALARESEDLYFVQEVLNPALGVSYNAEAVREVLVQLRTCFRLPQYVVDLLEAEMKARKLNILAYVQELLLRRYEALRDGPRQSRPVGPTRREPRR